jgi:hypothetical protein
MKTAKIKYVLWLAAFIAALLVGWYFWGPTGGKLISLSESNAPFVQEFDGAANNERVLLLLSPT